MPLSKPSGELTPYLGGRRPRGFCFMLMVHPCLSGLGLSKKTGEIVQCLERKAGRSSPYQVIWPVRHGNKHAGGAAKTARPNYAC